MVDADAEVVGTILDHVLERGEDVAGTHVAAAQTGGGPVNPRRPVDPILTVLTSHRVAERRLDFAGQVIAGRGERVVHALEDRDRAAVFAAP